MKVGTENKRKLYIAGVLGFFAVFAIYSLYSSFFGGNTTPPPPAPVIRDASGPGVPHAALSAGSTGVLAPPGFAVGEKAAVKVGTGGG